MVIGNISNQNKRTIPIAPVAVLYITMAIVGFCYQGMTTMLPTYMDSKRLFSINTDFQADLDDGKFSDSLRQEFYKNGLQIPQDVNLSIKKIVNRWTLSDGNKTNYTIRKEANNLRVYVNTGKGMIYVTMILLVGMLGQYIGGHTADRHRKTRLYMLFNSLSLPFMIMLGLLSGAGLIIVAALFAMFHFAGQPVENSLVAQYTPSNLRSSGYGLKFVFAFGIGSFASAFSGYIGEYFGLNSIFYALSGVIFLAMITMTILILVAKEQKVETA